MDTTPSTVPYNNIGFILDELNQTDMHGDSFQRSSVSRWITNESHGDSLLASSIRDDDFGRVLNFIVSAKDGDARQSEAFLKKLLHLLHAQNTFGDGVDDIVHTLPGLDLDTEVEPPEDSMFIAFVDDEIDNKMSTLVMLVPGQAYIVGHLIGKAGSEIGRLEKDCGVTIRIESKSKMPPGSLERRIYIVGTVSACVKTQQVITAKLYEKLKEEGVQQELIKIVIPHESVPHLIGKSGSNIKKLQELSGARIQVEQEDYSQKLPGNIGRSVTIQGRQYNRSMAQYLIARQMAENRSTRKDWQGGIPQPITPTAPTMYAENAMYRGPEQQGEDGIYGDTAAFTAKPPSAPELVSDGEQNEVENGEESMLYEMLVPDASVAHLIGRAGSVISEIQRKSNTRISFNRVYKGCENATGKFQKVTISGSSAAIQAAYCAIVEKLDELS